MSSIIGTPDSFYLESISARAFADAHHLLILETHGHLQHTLKALQVLAEFGVRGIIVHSGHFEPIPRDALLELHSQNIVLIAIDVTPTAIPVDHVSLDETALAETAVDYLLELGHRHIALIAHLGDGGFSGRPLAIKRALQQRRIPLQATLNADQKNYHDDLIAMLTHPHRPTAFITTTDYTAALVLHTARQLGIRIPQDVSVIGCTSCEMPQFFSPPLTTFDLNFVEIGQTAASLLFHRMNEGCLPDRSSVKKLYSTPNLIKRASCGPANFNKSRRYQHHP
jgi:LacI family transcriptional regulator